MESDKNLPSAENPEKLLNLTATGPKKWAAGIPAVVAALSDIIEEGIPLRGTGALFVMNQKGGFDCSSCAWPDPDHDRSPVGEYCENGAKALAEEATTKTVTPAFFAQNSVFDLAKLTDYEIGKKGRITEPMYLPKGGSHYQPISWDDAFTKIGTHLNALETADEAIFYTSGRTSNETSFLYQLFAKEFGTNNMPDCSNMCHETSGSALKPVIGIGKGTVKLDDFYDTDLIIIIGQNPGTNAPRMMSALEKGKQSGAKIIAGSGGLGEPSLPRRVRRAPRCCRLRPDSADCVKRSITSTTRPSCCLATAVAFGALAPRLVRSRIAAAWWPTEA